ncbi:hypothetical protein [Streptomyces sp. NPDC003327]
MAPVTPPPAPATAPVHRDEVTAVHGARWIATAAVVVGAVNYAYALVLTRLLDVAGYATFAAGQGLVVCASAVAVVTVPWMLAQALARAGLDAERTDAVRFAVVTAVSGGVVAAVVVGVVAAQFAGSWSIAAVAGSTLLVYVTRVSAGWLQGTERLRTLAVLHALEAVLKLGVGLFLVTALGLGEAGALAAFGIAVLPYVFVRPRGPRGGARRPWRAVSADRELWRRAVGVASLQGVVALLAAVDVVLVAVLPTDRAAAASYQAAVMLGRVPIFLAGAVSIAFLPALSRRAGGHPMTGGALRMYLTVALPVTVVAATVPGAVLTAVFPPGYATVATLMPCTATAGLALGALALLVTFAQAVNDYACLRTLLAGLVLYVAALGCGWAAGGVVGMAVGGLCGTVAALALLAVRHARRYGFGGADRPPGRAVKPGRVEAAPVEPGPAAKAARVEPGRAVGLVVVPVLVVAGALVALRPYPVAWLALAVAVSGFALWRFFGRGGSPVPGATSTGPDHPPGVPTGAGAGGAAGGGAAPSPAPSRAPSRAVVPAPVHDGRAVPLLVEAVWRGRVRPAGDEELRAALAAARLNQVEGRLARAYPRQLAGTLCEVELATGLFRRNLVESTGLLRAAGIPTVLIKADLGGDYVYGNFDLVIPPGRLAAAQDALTGWYAHRSTYWLERTSKVLLEPPTGPAAHLHGSVSWFGVPVVPTERLFARAERADGSGRADSGGRVDGAGRVDGGGWLTPCPADRLRIWLAHALFQNLTLDLSELLALRDLLDGDVLAEARAEAAREGWSAGGAAALATAVDAMARLDRGEPVPLPLPLPVRTSLRVGAEHSGHLLGDGRVRAAAREAALRVPLVVTKRLRRRVP